MAKCGVFFCAHLSAQLKPLHSGKTNEMEGPYQMRRASHTNCTPSLIQLFEFLMRFIKKLNFLVCERAGMVVFWLRMYDQLWLLWNEMCVCVCVFATVFSCCTKISAQLSLTVITSVRRVCTWNGFRFHIYRMNTKRMPPN